MKLTNLTKRDKELVQKARRVARSGYVKRKGITSDVSCCLITNKGNLFTGMDIEGFISGVCAESSAVSNMIKDGKGKENISAIVALYDDWPKYKKNDYLILPPCGACRHNLSKFGNPWVIVSKTKKIKLKDLYPIPFKG